MRRTLLLFAFVLIWIAPASGQSAVVSWFPIHVGDRWIYEHETRDDNGGGTAHLEIHRWRTEETTVGSWPSPEGMLVARRVRVIEGSPPPDWIDPERERAYLIRGHCLYGSEVEWGSRDHHISTAFREDLLAGHVAADFCFPLVVGKTWGRPAMGRMARTRQRERLASHRRRSNGLIGPQHPRHLSRHLGFVVSRLRHDGRYLV